MNKPDRHSQAPESRQGDMQPAVAKISVEHHSLNPGAIRDDSLKDNLGDAEITEREMGQRGEGEQAAAIARKFTGPDVEHAERGGEAERRGGQLRMAGIEIEVDHQFLKRVE